MNTTKFAERPIGSQLEHRGSHGGIRPEVQEGLAKLMGVSEANVRLEFCRRVLTAYARGRIPYDDYLQFMQGGGMLASVLRALRISGSGPKKPPAQGKAEIVLPASASMDSGKTFKGSTVQFHRALIQICI